MKLPKKLEEFANLPVKQRRAAFMRFLKKNPKKEYNYSSIKDCVLGAFANSLTKSKEFTLVGGAWSIFFGYGKNRILGEIVIFERMSKESIVISENNNFAELYRKLIKISPNLAVKA